MRLSLTFFLVFLGHLLPAQTFTQITLNDDNLWSEGGNWIDYDDDGDLDLFIPNNPRSPTVNSMYENNGDGTFTKQVFGILVTDGVMSESGTWGDYDNDGDLDLFVGDGGFDLPRMNSLYRNEGNGNFNEVTAFAMPSEPSYSTSTSWADYDNDGFLDLYCANLTPANNTSVPGKDLIYHNDGDGTFTKVTTGALANTAARCFGVAWSDYDNDGDVDLFVCHNSGSNFLQRNNGNGSFTTTFASSVGSIVADGGSSIACSWGDYNNDGFMDLFVGNWGQNDFLYKNDGDGSFTRVTTGPVVQNSNGNAEASAWADFDNDGDLDLFVGNGGAGQQQDYFYENNGDGTFTKIFNETTAPSNCTAGACWGDYDNDGDQDLFVANFSGKKSNIFRNETTGNHWLNIRCIGTQSNRSAIGTKVRVRAMINGQAIWQLREISGQTGYNGQNSLRPHVGLGAATIADSVQIEWPSGLVEIYLQLAADSFYTFVEGQSTSITPDLTAAFGLSLSPNPTDGPLHFTYTLPTAATVKIDLFDLGGRHVCQLFEGNQGSGKQEVKANVCEAGLRRGMYFYRFVAGEKWATGKIIKM